MENAICPFCSTPYTEEMLEVIDGTYGCDTGCAYMRIVVNCTTCEKEVYIKGEFGESSYTPGWREEVTVEDIKEAVARPRDEYGDAYREYWEEHGLYSYQR